MRKLDPIYKELTEAFGISGRETKIRKIFEREIKKYKCYDIVYDNLGSIMAVKKSKNKNAKTVMLAGHLDEVGLMIQEILDSGAIKVIPIGGLRPEVFVSQVLYIDTGNKLLPGIIGSIPPHIKQDNKMSFSDFLLDTGVSSKKELLKLGVKEGQQVLPKTELILNSDNTKVFAKALDDRWGCGMALELIRDFANVDLEYNLVIGATVQEEVGLRGAQTISQKINPDVFISLESSPVHDLENPSPNAKFDGGFLIRAQDPTNIMPYEFLEYFRTLAYKNKIDHQIYFGTGSTDAAQAQYAHDGVLTTTIGLPTRYIHSTCGMFSLKDHFSAHDFVRALLKDITNKKIKYLIENR